MQREHIIPPPASLPPLSTLSHTKTTQAGIPDDASFFSFCFPCNNTRAFRNSLAARRNGSAPRAISATMSQYLAAVRASSRVVFLVVHV